MKSKTFDLSQYQPLSVTSFTMKRINGYDELAAAERVTSGNEGASLGEQMIAESITQVDGQDVTTPYVDWAKWCSVTRDFVRAAFDKFNNADKDQIKDFLAEAFGAEEAMPAERTS